MITLDDLKACKIKQRSHGHGDGMFFYLWQCIEQPRLSRYDLYTRKDRSTKSTWRVDGEDVADLAAAAEKLNTPPVLTDEERALLATVPDGWTDVADERGKLALKLYSLDIKGPVEWEKGRYRRRPQP